MNHKTFPQDFLNFDFNWVTFEEPKRLADTYLTYIHAWREELCRQEGEDAYGTNILFC